MFLVSITVPPTSVFDPVSSNSKTCASALVEERSARHILAESLRVRGHLKRDQELNELPILGAQMCQKNLTTIVLLLSVSSRCFNYWFGYKNLVCFVSWLPFSSCFEMPFSFIWSSGLAELLDCLLFPCLWNASTSACSFSYLFPNSVFEKFLLGAAADKKHLANETSSFMLDDWQLCDWNDNFYPSIKY